MSSTAYDLPPNLDPDGTPPREIVYCQLSASTADGQISLYMPRQNWVFHNVDIDGLINKLRNPQASKELKPDEIYGPTDTTKTACDITIADTCYIVLELAGYANWHFQCDSPAVHMADPQDDAAPDNWGLMHVASDGSHSARPVSNCQIAYFRVSRREPNSSRPFNFNIEIEDKDYKRAIPIIIDPDTNNTGQIPAPAPPSS